MPVTPQRLHKRDEADLARIAKAQAEIDDLTKQRAHTIADLARWNAKLVKARARRDGLIEGLLGRGIRPFTIVKGSGVREHCVATLSAAMTDAGSRPAPRK